MSSKLYEEILEGQKEKDLDSNSNKTGEETVWLIFRCGLSQYAVEAEKILEILRTTTVYPIPFVPPYIRGMLNFYGKPYSVIDFDKFQNPLLEENLSQEKNVFIVFNDENNYAFQVNDILDFFNTDSDDRQKLKTESGFFTDAIYYNETLTPILNLDEITNSIRDQLENK